MREAEDLDPPDADVPGVLRGMTPAMPSASVARSIWYQSGYRAGRRQVNAWRGATVALALGTAALLGWQQVSRRADDSNRTIAVQVPTTMEISPKMPAVDSGSASYARLLNSLTQDGPRKWAEDDLPAGNPHMPPTPQKSTDRFELNPLPIN